MSEYCQYSINLLESTLTQYDISQYTNSHAV